jgi:hypothetical protein
MWKLLGTLVSGFLLLRDVFGYLLPGALFLVLVGSHTPPHQSAWLIALSANFPFVSVHFWFFTTTMLLVSYLAGQILVAIGYESAHLVECSVGWIKGKKRPEAQPPSVDELYYRYLYPSIFTEVDRRGTINILRLGVAFSLLTGSGFLFSQSKLIFTIAVLIGAFMVYNWVTGRSHVRDVAKNSLCAAERAARNKIPPFNWNAGEKEAGKEGKDDEKAEAAAVPG